MIKKFNNNLSLREPSERANTTNKRVKQQRSEGSKRTNNDEIKLYYSCREAEWNKICLNNKLEVSQTSWKALENFPPKLRSARA